MMEILQSSVISLSTRSQEVSLHVTSGNGLEAMYSYLVISSLLLAHGIINSIEIKCAFVGVKDVLKKHCKEYIQYYTFPVNLIVFKVIKK